MKENGKLNEKLTIFTLLYWKYIIHFILVLSNWKYVHNFFSMLLPNFGWCVAPVWCGQLISLSHTYRRKRKAPGMARPFMFVASC